MLNQLPTFERDRDFLTFNQYVMRRSFMMKNMIMMMILMLIVTFMLFAFVFFATPLKKIMEAKYEIMKAQVAGLTILPDIESKIAIIEKQTANLTTDNIEARLNKIEKAIAVGEVKSEDLKSLQDLRNEFSIFKTYMFAQPEKMLEFRTIQKEYTDLKTALLKMAYKEDVQREIDFLKTLFYATLAIVGILVSIFAGAWFVAFKQKVKPPESPQEN